MSRPGSTGSHWKATCFSHTAVFPCSVTHMLGRKCGKNPVQKINWTDMQNKEHEVQIFHWFHCMNSSHYSSSLYRIKQVNLLVCFVMVLRCFWGCKSCFLHCCFPVLPCFSSENYPSFVLWVPISKLGKIWFDLFKITSCMQITGSKLSIPR